jgi:hypothetical protein
VTKLKAAGAAQGETRHEDHLETHSNQYKVDVIDAWSAPKKACVSAGKAVAALMAALIEC